MVVNSSWAERPAELPLAELMLSVLSWLSGEQGTTMVKASWCSTDGTAWSCPLWAAQAGWVSHKSGLSALGFPDRMPLVS